jgi:hypothetical protein
MRFQFLFLVFLLTACAAPASPKPEIISSKVTVTTAGKQIDDFNNEFVHRAEISKAQLDRLINGNLTANAIDQSGKTMGLQAVVDIPGLSLKSGDILTAIGTKVIREGDSLALLKTQLQNKESSITFLRLGRAHKTLIKLH